MGNLLEEYKNPHHRPHLALRLYGWSKYPRLVICYYNSKTNERKDIGIFRDGLGRKVGVMKELRQSLKEIRR